MQILLGFFGMHFNKRKSVAWFCFLLIHNAHLWVLCFPNRFVSANNSPNAMNKCSAFKQRKKTLPTAISWLHMHTQCYQVFRFHFFYSFFFFLGISSISPSYDTIVFKSHSKYICSTRSLQIIFILIFVKVNGEKNPFAHST